MPSPKSKRKQPQFSNLLTDAEAERLALLIEECAEISQIACKILRHGYESYNPLKPQSGSNRAMLEREFGDLTAVTIMMEDAGDILGEPIEAHSRAKLRRIGKYLHHQPDPLTPTKGSRV